MHILAYSYCLYISWKLKLHDFCICVEHMLVKGLQLPYRPLVLAIWTASHWLLAMNIAVVLGLLHIVNMCGCITEQERIVCSTYMECRLTNTARHTGMQINALNDNGRENCVETTMHLSYSTLIFLAMFTNVKWPHMSPVYLFSCLCSVSGEMQHTTQI